MVTMTLFSNIGKFYHFSGRPLDLTSTHFICQRTQVSYFMQELPDCDSSSTKSSWSPMRLVVESEFGPKNAGWIIIGCWSSGFFRSPVRVVIFFKSVGIWYNYLESHSAGLEITGFPDFRDTKKWCRKPQSWSRVSEWPRDCHVDGNLKLGFSERKPRNRHGNTNFERGFPNGNPNFNRNF